MAKELRVVVSKDGPYMVTGGPPLSRQTIVTDAEGGSERWQEGETFKVRDSYALCRCGHSNTKPFCDGTHETIGFDGTETAGREPYRRASEASRGAGAVAFGCGRPVRVRPFLRSPWQRVERGRAHRRAGDAGAISRPGASLPGRPPGRLGQRDRPAARTGVAGLDRSRRGSAGKVQRPDLAAWRNPGRLGRRLCL